MESKTIPEELKAAGQEVVRVTGDLDTLKKELAREEGQITDMTAISPEALVKLDELRAEVARAELELERVKSRYNTLLTRWKYQE